MGIPARRVLGREQSGSFWGGDPSKRTVTGRSSELLKLDRFQTVGFWRAIGDKYDAICPFDWQSGGQKMSCFWATALLLLAAGRGVKTGVPATIASVERAGSRFEATVAPNIAGRTRAEELRRAV